MFMWCHKKDLAAVVQGCNITSVTTADCMAADVVAQLNLF